MKHAIVKKLGWSLIFLVAISVLTLVGCDDILEDDISNDEVVLFAPAEGVQLDSGNVTFVWDPLEDALDYRLLLVSPDFENPAQVWADTITTATSFTTALGPGTYTWGINAANSVYTTAFFTRTFTVVEVTDPDISDRSPNLISPAAGLEVDAGTFVFLWDTIRDATDYNLRIVSPSFENIRTVIADTVTSLSRASVQLDSGVYEWGVQALNASSLSMRSVRSITVDVAFENRALEIISPSEGATLDSGSVVFIWEPLRDAETYEFQLVTPTFDAISTIVSEQEVNADRVSINLNPGSYQWSLRAVNGNKKTERIVRSLTVQQAQ